MRTVKTLAVGLGGAVVTGIVAQITMTCPDLLPKLPAIAAAGAMAGIALWMQRPQPKV